MVKVAVIGVAGRMGRTLIEAAKEYPNIRLGAAIESKGSQLLGMDAGLLAGNEELNVKISDSLAGEVDHFDVVVDFSRPAGSLAALSICAEHGKAAVVGTTGFTENERKKIKHFSSHIPIMHAANMSVGVNLCLNLLEKAAHVLADDYDIEVIEAHHRHKVDVAQWIWYFTEGYYQRLGDFPISNKGLTEYVVDWKGEMEKLTFWKSPRSGRWWLQVPVKTSRKQQRHAGWEW